MSRSERRAMVVRGHTSLSLSRQCRLLSIGRSSLYYEAKGESTETLALMQRIDELNRVASKEGTGLNHH